MRIDSRMVAFVAILALTGCDGGGGDGESAREFIESLPEASIVGTADVIAFAGMASAPNAFAAGAAPVALAQFAGENGGCPNVSQSGNTVTITGGCTDTSGQTWSGTAVSGDTLIRYDDFSIASVDTCGAATFNTLIVFNGTMQPSGTGFDVDLRFDLDGYDEETCLAASGTVAWYYSGTSVQGTGETMTWSGSGIVGMQGVRVAGDGSLDAQVDGYVEAETVGEVLNGEVCPDEALSGTTTLISGATTVVVTYDGLSDCDVESTARWSLNGTDRGEISGIACSVSRVESSPLGFVLAMLAGLGILLRRR